MVALAAERNAEDGVSSGKLVIERDCLTELSGGEVEFAELALDQAEFEMQFGGRLGSERLLEFDLGGGWVVLLEVDSCNEFARGDVRRIESDCGLQFRERGSEIAEVVLRCSEGEVCSGPLGPEAKSFFEFFGGLFGLALVFQR